MVALLLKRGADVRAKTSGMDHTGLLMAAEQGDTGTALLMLGRGADIETKSGDGVTYANPTILYLCTSVGVTYSAPVYIGRRPTSI